MQSAMASNFLVHEASQLYIVEEDLLIDCTPQNRKRSSQKTLKPINNLSRKPDIKKSKGVLDIGTVV
eukprot:4857269-Amphidinium_carterae.1